MKIHVFDKMSSPNPCWADLGLIWVAKRGRLGRPFGTKVGSKRVRQSDAKKGLVLGGLGGGVGAIAVGQLGAGSDKGETGLRLPPRLFVGFAHFCFDGFEGLVVLFCVCCGTFLVLSCVVLFVASAVVCLSGLFRHVWYSFVCVSWFLV